MSNHSVPKKRATRCARRTASVLAMLGFLSAAWVGAYEVTGVEPYALDQPRVQAMLIPVGGNGPLSYESALTGARLYAFDWFLDSGASRISLSKADRDTLGAKATDNTVEDWGIAGTEQFDVSIPYELRVGDTGADPSDPAQFPFTLRCVLQLRQSDQNALDILPKGLAEDLDQTAEAAGLSRDEMGQLLMPAVDVVGTPFLQEHVVILDPRPVAAAMDIIAGMLQGGGGGANQQQPDTLDELIGGLIEAAGEGSAIGQIKVDVIAPGESYVPPQLVVPLVMKRMVDEPVPVTDAAVPFVASVTLENGDRKVKADLLLDTGGAVSFISTRLAQELGVDLDRPDMQAPIMGVGQGIPEIKGYWLTRATVPTAGGDAIVYQGVPFFVADVAGIDGTVGANLFVPSAYVDLNAQTLQADPTSILTSIRRGVTPFSRIVLDLPNKRLGLDPMPAVAEQPVSPAAIAEPND